MPFRSISSISVWNLNHAKLFFQYGIERRKKTRIYLDFWFCLYVLTTVLCQFFRERRKKPMLEALEKIKAGMYTSP